MFTAIFTALLLSQADSRLEPGTLVTSNDIQDEEAVLYMKSLELRPPRLDTADDPEPSRFDVAMMELAKLEQAFDTVQFFFTEPSSDHAQCTLESDSEHIFFPTPHSCSFIFPCRQGGLIAVPVDRMGSVLFHEAIDLKPLIDVEATDD